MPPAFRRPEHPAGSHVAGVYAVAPAARLAVLGLWLGDKLGSSLSPEFVAGLNIGNADLHEAADGIGVGGDAERYRWFVGCRTAADVDNEPRVRDLEVTRRALAIASAQNATTEDRFVKSKRSLDIGDGDKVCDGDAVLRRHLIGFWLDLYLVHGRLQSGYGIFAFARIRRAVRFGDKL
jgi:hypothetical protein